MDMIPSVDGQRAAAAVDDINSNLKKPSMKDPALHMTKYIRECSTCCRFPPTSHFTLSLATGLLSCCDSWLSDVIALSGAG